MTAQVREHLTKALADAHSKAEALWPALKAVEQEMEPLKCKYERIRKAWADEYNREQWIRNVIETAGEGVPDTEPANREEWVRGIVEAQP